VNITGFKELSRPYKLAERPLDPGVIYGKLDFGK